MLLRTSATVPRNDRVWPPGKPEFFHAQALLNPTPVARIAACPPPSRRFQRAREERPLCVISPRSAATAATTAPNRLPPAWTAAAAAKVRRARHPVGIAGLRPSLAGQVSSDDDHGDQGRRRRLGADLGGADSRPGESRPVGAARRARHA